MKLNVDTLREQLRDSIENMADTRISLSIFDTLAREFKNVHKHCDERINALEAEVKVLEVERRQNALDGQAALDEANSAVIGLQASQALVQVKDWLLIGVRLHDEVRQWLAAHATRKARQ